MNQSGLTYEAGWFDRAILACILAAGRCWKKHAVDRGVCMLRLMTSDGFMIGDYAYGPVMINHGSVIRCDGFSSFGGGQTMGDGEGGFGGIGRILAPKIHHTLDSALTSGGT